MESSIAQFLQRWFAFGQPPMQCMIYCKPSGSAEGAKDVSKKLCVALFLIGNAHCKQVTSKRHAATISDRFFMHPCGRGNDTTSDA